MPLSPDLDAKGAATATAADDDASVDSVTNGVGHQIEEYAFERNGIAADEGATRNHPQPQTFFSRSRCERHFDALEQVIHRELRNVGCNHASL